MVGKVLSLCLCAIALVGFLSASGGTSPVAEGNFAALNIIPYSPGTEEVAAKDAAEYAERTGNAVVLYSLTLHPQGKPARTAVDRAVASYRRFSDLLAGTKAKPGILLQAIVGHWPRTDREIEPWQRTVNIKGEEVRFCALDKGYRDYIRYVGEQLAACHPCLILTDDDVRAFSPEAECFCPLHTAAFNARTGRHLTPEDYRKLITDSKRTSPEHKAFTDLQRETVLTVCRTLRAGIDSVDATIPGGVCLAGWTWEGLRTKDYARAMAAKGQRPFLRLPNGRYTEGSPKWDLHEGVLKTMALQGILGDDVLLLDESDTWPHNLWAKSAAAVHAKLAASVFLGLSGAKLWFVNAHKNGYPVSRAYTDVLAAHKGYYPALAAAVRGAGPCGGIAIVSHEGFPFNHVKDRGYKLSCDGGNWAQRVFGVFGVPFHVAKGLDEDAIYALAGGDAVGRCTNVELKRLLSRRVLLDAWAARIIAKRGFSDLIGVRVTDEKPVCTGERDEVTGEDVTFPKTSVACRFEAIDGVQVKSSLVWRPFYGSPDFDRVAPSAVLCTNALGGTVMTVAYQMNMGSAYSYSEGRKAWLLRRLADLNGGAVPDGVIGDNRNAMALVRRATDGSSLVFVSNLGFDPTSSVTLTCANRPREVSILSPRGAWQSVPADWQNGSLTLTLSMPCYEVAVLRIRCGGE